MEQTLQENIDPIMDTRGPIYSLLLATPVNATTRIGVKFDVVSFSPHQFCIFWSSVNVDHQAVTTHGTVCMAVCTRHWTDNCRREIARRCRGVLRANDVTDGRPTVI